MSGRRQLTLDRWLLFVFAMLVITVILLLWSTNLLWRGVTTKGLIVNKQPISCNIKSYADWYTFSVRFTDQSGQIQTGSISQCEYPDFDAAPGDSVSIVYLPGDSTTFVPADALLPNVLIYLVLTILSGLITLILLPLWIRKRIREASQLDRPELRVKQEKWPRPEEAASQQDRPEFREPSTEQIQQDRPEP